MIDSIVAAQYIMYICDKKKTSDSTYEYNNTKIQKLLYCAYGIHWASYKLRLTHEIPKYWPYGPVFQKVFNHIKEYDFSFCEENFSNISEEVKETLELAVEIFGGYTAGILSNWSHSKESPWKSMKESGAKYNDQMSDNLIKEYFEKHLVKSE